MKENILDSLSRQKIRQLVLLFLDLSSVFIAFIFSINLVDYHGGINSLILFPISIYLVFNTISFFVFKCYSSLWRYAGDKEIISIFLACISYVIPVYFVNEAMGYSFSKLFYILNTLFICTFTCGFRLLYRVSRKMMTKNINLENRTRVLIIGAGSAGSMVINELYNNPKLNKEPVVVVDDDRKKIGRRINGVEILGTTEDLEKIVKKYNIEEIILAISSINSNDKKNIIKKCRNTGCKLKTIPGIDEIIDGKVDVKKIRDVEIEDLLGREPIKVDLDTMSEYLTDKVVLVTGGGGSIGSELCRQIAQFKPRNLIILDNYENNAYDIQQELIRKYKNELNLTVIIATIREKYRIEEVFKEYMPEVVFHAAAHKHVPLMEGSPGEAIKNNVFGTKNVAELADKYKAKKFVLISTDKAVNPTNIMGATKRAAEMVIQTINEKSETDFVSVRFGNVLGSNGSVIPLFKKQIQEGGPVNITHPNIIRYFMTIPEAVQLVIQAGAMAKGGEIFILDMGDPVKILDLANNLIRLSGLEPNVDIEVKFTGLRPGEKLYEELLMSEEGISKTDNKKIFIGKQLDIDSEKVDFYLNELNKVVENEEVEKIDSLMRKLVTTYIKPEDANNKEVI